MHPGVPGRIWAGQVGSKSENIQKKIRFLKILERNFPIFSKKMFFLYKMGALEVTFVYNIESKIFFKIFSLFDLPWPVHMRPGVTKAVLRCQKWLQSDPKVATKSSSYAKSDPKVIPKSASHDKSDVEVTSKWLQSYFHTSKVTHFGVTLVSLWDHFDVTLGSLWYHFGITLWSLRGHFGITFFMKLGMYGSIDLTHGRRSIPVNTNLSSWLASSRFPSFICFIYFYLPRRESRSEINK